jgi:hypothetical protein
MSGVNREVLARQLGARSAIAATAIPASNWRPDRGIELRLLPSI